MRMRGHWFVSTVLLAGAWMLAALIAGGCAGPRTSPAADALRIEGVWARPPARTAMGVTGAVYMRIHNGGAADDALVGAATDIAKRVELHETRTENNVMRMAPVERFRLPAGATTELKPGGMHVMLIELNREFKVGDRFSLRLQFERAGERRVDVTVREP